MTDYKQTPPERISGRQDGLPFITASLDDAGLTAQEYRVYCHLSRRAGKNGKAWPSIGSISKICRLHPDTVGQIIKRLVDLGMIRRENRTGTSNVYRLPPPSLWKVPPGNKGLPLETRGDENNGYPIPEPEGHPVPESKGDHQPETEGYKGTTTKIRNEVTPLNSFAPALPDANRDGALSSSFINDSRKNALLASLVVSTGANPTELTDDSVKQFVIALHKILNATPRVTPKEIRERAKEYHKRWPKMAITPLALAKHWHALGTTVGASLANGASEDGEGFFASLDREEAKVNSQHAVQVAAEAAFAKSSVEQAALP